MDKTKISELNEALDALWNYAHAAGTSHGEAKHEYEQARSLLLRHGYWEPGAPGNSGYSVLCPQCGSEDSACTYCGGRGVTTANHAEEWYRQNPM